MKRIRDFFGYLLGGVLFVALIPTIMWLASGMPALWPIDTGRCIVAPVVMFVGLVLSIWTIVYMRNRGKGNPMDAFGHEVAPRTQHLMIEGPYKINRNPMLTGTLVYLVRLTATRCLQEPSFISWVPPCGCGHGNRASCLLPSLPS